MNPNLSTREKLALISSFCIALTYLTSYKWYLPTYQEGIVLQFDEIEKDDGASKEDIMCNNCKYMKTPLVSDQTWSGSWPEKAELPLSQRRDTACPMTLVNKTQSRIKRWPDIIGAGFPKCGTGTLAFLDCHDDIVFREAEGLLWQRFNSDECEPSLEKYAVPKAAVDEILIEKTPEIVSGNYNQLLGRAKCMKRHNPDLSILFALCDPVKRYISHAKHKIHFDPNVKRRDLRTISRVQSDVRRLLKGNKTQLTEPRFVLRGLTDKQTVSSARTFAYGPDKPVPPSQLLLYGNYHQQMTPFIEVFGIDKVIFVDGTNMGNSEAVYLETRLGLKHQLRFEFNAKKHFNCLTAPHAYCLSDAKGRPSTVDKRAKLSHEIEVLEGYFKPQMVLLMKLIFPSMTRDEFCHDEQQRFQWLKSYVC